MSSDDLLKNILSLASLFPEEFVAASRVSKSWRRACLEDASIMLRSARLPRFLTKRVLMGLLALSNEEANKLPRDTRPRWGGGFMYMYRGHVAVGAFETMVGGTAKWRKRLSRRGEEEKEAKKSREIAVENGWMSTQSVRHNHGYTQPYWY